MESKVKPGDAELASAVSSALTVQIAEGWSPGHVKETQFIDKKRKRNLFEGIREGNVDPNDLDIDDLRAVEQLAHKYADTVAKAIQTKLRPPPVSGSVQDLMAGAKVFVDGNGLRIDLVPGSVTLVKNRNAADIMVADIANLSRRTMLAVGLNGGVVASPDFLSSNGRIGAAIVFKRATSISRRVWMSPGFVRAHPVYASIVREACTRKGSKFRCVQNKLEFLNFMLRSGRQGRQSREVALVTAIEKSTGMFKSADYAFDAPAALICFGQVDVGASHTGLFSLGSQL